jgi:hypothetical protein
MRPLSFPLTPSTAAQLLHLVERARRDTRRWGDFVVFVRGLSATLPKRPQWRRDCASLSADSASLQERLRRAEALLHEGGLDEAVNELCRVITLSRRRQKLGGQLSKEETAAAVLARARRLELVFFREVQPETPAPERFTKRLVAEMDAVSSQCMRKLPGRFVRAFEHFKAEQSRFFPRNHLHDRLQRNGAGAAHGERARVVESNGDRQWQSASPIEAGDVVLRDMPVVTIPLASENGDFDHCCYCFEPMHNFYEA